MSRRAFLLACLLTATALAGCATPDNGSIIVENYQDLGFDGETWPQLPGAEVVILDHGAFPAFGKAARAFKNLTGIEATHIEADDTGSALNLAIQEKGDPTFDVLYGIDNILFQRAVQEDLFEPYRPLFASRIQSEYVFFDEGVVGWPATPVDHGYIAVNYDANRLNATLTTLDDIVPHAHEFVTQDPRTSTPGLGFLLATIATYGDEGSTTWKDYWADLFEGGVLVTAGWTEAYEQHFSAGYGAAFGGLADKAIVTSYTESPAYEAFFGRDASELAEVILAPQASFHQIQTMGIVKGAENRVAAQAWIEFTLTDAFQSLAAPENAVYPVVAGIDVNATYGDHDPEPGSFEPADLGYAEIGRNLERWVNEWVDLCEEHDCA